MTNDLLKTIENYLNFTPWTVCIHENYSVFYSEIENNVLLSWNVSASHGIAMHFQSQRYFVGSISKFKTRNLFTKTFHVCVTPISHRHLGSCFQEFYNGSTLLKMTFLLVILKGFAKLRVNLHKHLLYTTLGNSVRNPGTLSYARAPCSNSSHLYDMDLGVRCDK